MLSYSKSESDSYFAILANIRTQAQQVKRHRCYHQHKQTNQADPPHILNYSLRIAHINFDLDKIALSHSAIVMLQCDTLICGSPICIADKHSTIHITILVGLLLDFHNLPANIGIMLLIYMILINIADRKYNARQTDQCPNA